MPRRLSRTNSQKQSQKEQGLEKFLDRITNSETKMSYGCIKFNSHSAYTDVSALNAKNITVRNISRENLMLKLSNLIKQRGTKVGISWVEIKPVTKITFYIEDNSRNITLFNIKRFSNSSVRITVITKKDNIKESVLIYNQDFLNICNFLIRQIILKGKSICYSGKTVLSDGKLFATSRFPYLNELLSFYKNNIDQGKISRNEDIGSTQRTTHIDKKVKYSEYTPELTGKFTSYVQSNCTDILSKRTKDVTSTRSTIKFKDAATTESILAVGANRLLKNPILINPKNALNSQRESTNTESFLWFGMIYILPIFFILGVGVVFSRNRGVTKTQKENSNLPRDKDLPSTSLLEIKVPDIQPNRSCC